MARRLAKKKNCTLGDLWKSFGLGALDDALVVSLAPSREVTRKMLKELSKAGKQCPALALHAQRMGWMPRRGVSPGDENEYVVQGIEKQLIIRIPVDILGVVRGQVLSVRFDRDAIVVSRKAS